MADFGRDVRKILSEHGCVFVRRGKGDHDIWYSPLTNKNFPVDNKIKSRHTANAIMRQSGISYRFKILISSIQNHGILMSRGFIVFIYFYGSDIWQNSRRILAAKAAEFLT